MVTHNEINLKDNIISIESGKRPKGGALSSGIPSLGAEHLNNNGGFNLNNKKMKYVPSDFFENMNVGIIKKDDIIVVKDGATTGKVSFVDNNFKYKTACINEHLFLVRVNNCLCSKFVFYFLYSDYGKSKVLNDFRGATVGGITKSFINFDIPCPPMEVQRKIADVLDKAKELIDKRKEQIKKLDEFIQSVFYDMFGDPVKNPEGWEVKKLKNLSSKILSGTTPKGGKEVYVEEGIVFFRSQNVWKNRLVFDDIAYLDEETHSKMMNSSLKNKDILMTKTGRINTENSSLGRAAMFLGEDDSANINGHVYLIRLQENSIHEFVLFIFTMTAYRDYIRRVCVGGIDKRQINKDHLEEFPIISPPLELQNKFKEIFEKTESQKRLLQKSLVEMENNFNGLMQRAFSGKFFNN